jgi:hypothetical protein
MKPTRLTLFDVELGRSKFYRVLVDLQGDRCEVVDYQLKANANRRSYKPELDQDDKDMIFIKPSKARCFKEWGFYELATNRDNAK